MAYIGLAPGVSSQRMEDTFTATAGQTSFVPSSGYVPGNIDVYRNGVKLANGLEFTASDGITVVLNNACAAGDSVVLLSYIPRGLSDGYLKSESDAKFLTALNPNYTGTLTGGTGVINIGSGQVYKDASGNVGIGTSSPATRLDVVADANAYAIKVRGRVADNISILQFVNNANTVQQGYVQVDGSYNMNFGNNGGERMRIDSSGRLLVNSTSDVGGNNPAFSVNAENAAAFGNIMEARWTGTGSIYHLLCRNGNGLIGGVSSSGSTTSFLTSSDYRLKEQVAPMTGALAKNDLLSPVTYKWKVDGSDGQGFIAHELQAVFPDAVTGEKDAVDAEGNPVYQGIDTSFLVGHLVACIKELNAEVTALRADITALQGALNG